MRDYVDTSLVLKLLVQEPGSAAALALVKAERIRIPLTPFLALELETALQALHHRGMIPADALRDCHGLIDSMTSSGLMVRATLSADAIVEEARTLAPFIVGGTGCHTLDLLHVAAARLLGAKRFFSNDLRQLNAAGLCGLEPRGLRQD